MPVLGSWVGDAEIGAGAVVLSGNGKVGVRAGEELHRGGNLHADGLAVVGDVRVAGEVEDPAVDVGVGVDVEGFFNGFGELFYGGAGGTDPAGEVVGVVRVEEVAGAWVGVGALLPLGGCRGVKEGLRRTQ